MAEIASSSQLFDCPHLDVTVDPLKLRSTFPPVLCKAKPLWKPECLQYDESPLASNRGLLNAMVKCYNSENPQDAIMVRVLNVQIDSIINERSNEINGIKHLYTKGCAPKLLATFKNGFCYEFIHGEVLSPARLQEEPIWTRIAEEFAKYHTGTYEDEKLNRTLLLQDIWKQQLESFPTELKNPEHNERFQKEFPSADWLRKEFAMIIDHVSQIGSPVVLCHNDTRPENMIWNHQTGTIHFVDFEVICYNYQALELAQHFLRYIGISSPDFTLYPGKTHQSRWIRIYLRKLFALTGKNPDDITDLHVERLQIQVEKFRLMALLLSVFLISLANIVEDTSPGQLDLLPLSLGCLKEYKEVKDKVLGLSVPKI